MEEKESTNAGNNLPSLDQLKGEQIGEYRGINLARRVFQMRMKGCRLHQIAEAAGITVTEVKFILYGPRQKDPE